MACKPARTARRRISSSEQHKCVDSPLTTSSARWLDFGKKDRIRPVGGSPALDRARDILQLRLEPANKSGFRWWRLRVGGDERLRRAGIDPETGTLVSPEKWQLAVDRAIGELQDRKTRKVLYKQKHAAAILEMRRKQIHQPVADFARRPSYDQRLQINGAGLGEDSRVDQDLIRQRAEVEAGELVFGYTAPRRSPPIATSRQVISGPPHQKRRADW